MESTEGDGVRARGKKKIQVSAATLVDLKAALFQKQQQVKKEKAAQQHDTAHPREVSDKTSAIWRKAAPLKHGRRTTEGVSVQEESARERSLAEEAEYDRARRALEAKVALYDKLSKGQGLQEETLGEDGEEEDSRYLVDFTRKVYEEMLTVSEREEERTEAEEATKDTEREADKTGEQDEKEAEPGDEWIDYVDSLGRNRKCLAKDLPHVMALDRDLKEKPPPPPPRSPTPELLSEDMRMDRERREWERRAGEEEGRPIGPVHYQDVYPGEIRTHGVGYFAFSGEEEKREQQMNLLNKLRDQTLEQRQKREQMKQKRKEAMEARLAKVRQRKLKQEGVEEGGVADLEVEKKQEDVIASELQKMREEMEKREQEERNRQEEEKRARHVRPWDKGKVDFLKRRKQELEDERPVEFAPPQSYGRSGGSRDGRKTEARNETPPAEEPFSETSTSPNASETAPFPPPQTAPFPPPQTAPFPPPQTAPYPPPQSMPYPPQTAQYPGWPPFAASMYYMYPGVYGGYPVPGYYGMSQPGTSNGPGMGAGPSMQSVHGQMWPLPQSATTLPQSSMSVPQVQSSVTASQPNPNS